MTSEERHEIRYQRRKERREQKKKAFCREFDDFDTVFSYDHLYQSYRRSRTGVAWKASVQKYITQAPLMVNKTYEELQDGTFRSDGFYEFDLNERGKTRHIRSVTIKERVVQRCLCDHALVPVLSRSFIYDNSASLKGKGYHFAIKRLCKSLRRHYRKYGTDGYVLLFDFSKFFDNIPHGLCKNILRENFSDPRIISLTDHFIDMFGEKGLGLGSQISQIFALASADRLDHYIKEALQIKDYGRYMDDGYLIHRDKKYLKKCLSDIRKMCKKLGIVLNEKKTQIIPLHHGFTWLKCHFYITGSGKVIKKISRKSVSRARRKLKSLKRLVNRGILTAWDMWASFQSWRAYADNFNAWRSTQNMTILLNQLFNEREMI